MDNNTNLNEIIGKKIRYIRKKEKKTLKQLSSETSLSLGYLSNLERSVISPTIDQLQKICSALKINITEVLSESRDIESPVVRVDERKIFYTENDKVKYELLSHENNGIEGICITMQEGADYEKSSWGHSYDELGIVMEGKLSVELLDSEYLLNKGDAIYIKKNTLHTFRNAGKNVCVSCWFYIKN